MRAGNSYDSRRGASSGSNRMPALGVGVVDAEAVQMLSTWIDSLQ